MRKLHPALAALACAAILAGCSSTEGSGGTTKTNESTKPSAQLNLTDIPGQFLQPSTLTDAGESLAPVHSCVNVGGAANRAELTIVDCGSKRHTYWVVRRVVTPDQCGDTDRPFYNNTAEGGEWTACLDLAWDNSHCMDIRKFDVFKVDCNAESKYRKLKPIKIITGAVTATDCPGIGFPHPARRFTICAEIVN
ncbi:LppU/SCO3897 family protein [Mycobacteroides abscessus]|uniref:LppU/SCO3897 family protein n=1 Tax=Mycobacteroides abscessus TaxID=36809 RepID=UPI003B435992